MSTHKYVYHRPDMTNQEGQVYVNVHLLVGYTGNTPRDFLNMTAIIAATFPEATMDTVTCSIVTKSAYVKGFTLAMWNGYVPKNHNFGDWKVVPAGTMQEYYYA